VATVSCVMPTRLSTSARTTAAPKRSPPLNAITRAARLVRPEKPSISRRSRSHQHPASRIFGQSVRFDEKRDSNHYMLRAPPPPQVLLERDVAVSLTGR